MNKPARGANAKTQRRTPTGQWAKEQTPFNAAQHRPSTDENQSAQNINNAVATGKCDDEIIETLNMNGKHITRQQWDANDDLRRATRGYFAHRYAEAYR